MLWYVAAVGYASRPLSKRTPPPRPPTNYHTCTAGRATTMHLCRPCLPSCCLCGVAPLLAVSASAAHTAPCWPSCAAASHTRLRGAARVAVAALRRTATTRLPAGAAVGCHATQVSVPFLNRQPLCVCTHRFLPATTTASSIPRSTDVHVQTVGGAGDAAARGLTGMPVTGTPDMEAVVVAATVAATVAAGGGQAWQSWLMRFVS